MKIPLKVGFKNFEGVEVGVTGSPVGPEEPPLTVRHVLAIAITTEFKEDQNPVNVVQDKIQRFSIYQQLLATDKDTEFLEITSDEASYLKPRVARCFGVVVSGPVLKLLDGTEDKKPT